MEKEVQVEASTKDMTSGVMDMQTQDIQAVRFRCKNWKMKALQVFDSNTNNIMYTIDTKLRKPNLIFKHGDEGDQFGTGTFHATSSRIDLDINNQSVEMRPTKILSSTYAYPSPAFGNTTMTWKSSSGWKNLDYVLLDEQAMPVAKCSAPYLSNDFSGKVEFLTERAKDRETREEILIGGMSLMYLTLTMYYGAAT